METQLNWETDQRAIFTCAGQIGFDDRDHLPRKIDEVVGVRSNPQVIFDLEHVDFVNSAGIGALLLVHKLVNERRGKVVLANVPPKLMELFATTGLNRIIKLTDTMNEAHAFLDQAENGCA